MSDDWWQANSKFQFLSAGFNCNFFLFFCCFCFCLKYARQGPCSSRTLIWPKARRSALGRPATLLLLLLYCHILPGRGFEVRTLEVVHEAQLTEPFVAAHFRNRNIALLHKEGSLTIHMQKFKTYHTAGKDNGNRGVLLVPYTHCRISKTAFPAVLSTLKKPTQRRIN